MKRLFQSHLLDIGIFSLFFIVTLFIYTYRLTEITPGMWGDEVGLGQMIQEVMSKHNFIPFLPFNYGHPTLLVYLSAIAVYFLGHTVFALRIVSTIFGALSAAAFYILCRLLFKNLVAFTSTILFATSYVVIIVSRFAYEMSGAIFFLIAACIGLILIEKKQKYVGSFIVGLSCALGLYTYLAFRSLVPFLLFSAIFLIFKKKTKRLLLLVVLLFSFFIISFPLLWYGYAHPKEFNARFDSLNVFGQNLSSQEVTKELQGASFRTITMFGFTQDPNPRQNPGSAAPFDVFTSVLFISGLIYLWVKKRKIALLFTVLIAVILAGDILSLERIPEFHYYGLGHPNTLRISLLTPLVTLCIGFVLEFVYEHTYQAFLIIIPVVIISFLNLFLYFGQPPNQWIYSTNFVVPLKIIDILNSQNISSVNLSPTLYNLQHVKYFLKPSIRPVKFTFDCKLKSIPTGISVILSQDISCSSSQLNQVITSINYNVIQNPWGGIDAIIFQR